MVFNDATSQFEVQNDSDKKQVVVKQLPVPVSFASIENEWLVDPTLSDEQAGSVVSLCRVSNDWMVMRLPGQQISPMVFMEVLFPLATAYLPKVKKVLENAQSEH